MATSSAKPKGRAVKGSANAKRLTRLGHWARVGSRDMAVAGLSLPLLLLLLQTILQYGKHIFDTVSDVGLVSTYGVAVVAAAMVGIAFRQVVARERPIDPRIFLPCSLLCAALVYYLYASSIKVAWISDFQTMWRFAVDMAASGDYSVKSIYNERALPVLVPGVLLFGPDPAIVPYINGVMLLAVQAAGYDLARRASGHKAAQGFAVLWIGAMEPVLALPITSHDIWGLFFLTALVWGGRVAIGIAGAQRGRRRIACIAVFGVLLGALLTLLDMQRELGPVVVLGFVLALGLLWLRGGGWLQRNSVAVAVLVSVFAFHVATSSALKHAGYMLTSEQGKGLSQIRTGAYGSSLSNGRYQQGQVLQQNFFYLLDERDRPDLVRSIPLSDMALQPVARLSNILYRVREQARFGSQTYFYHAKAEPKWPRLIPFVQGYNISYSVLLACLAIVCVVPIARRGADGAVLGLFATLSVLVGGLLLAGESQPRYIFPLWFVLPQMVAYATAHGLTASAATEGRKAFQGWDLVRGGALACLAFFALAAMVRWAYPETRGRMLSGWDSGSYGLAGTPPAEKWFKDHQKMSASGIKREGGDTRAFGFGKLALVMRLPTGASAGGGVIAEKRLCVGRERRSLDFFYYMPYQNPGAAGSFTMRILMDGRPLWNVSLPGTPRIQHARIEDVLPPDTCGKLIVDLRTHREITSPSWIVATQTDVYFMRLVR